MENEIFVARIFKKGNQKVTVGKCNMSHVCCFGSPRSWGRSAYLSRASIAQLVRTETQCCRRTRARTKSRRAVRTACSAEAAATARAQPRAVWTETPPKRKILWAQSPRALRCDDAAEPPPAAQRAPFGARSSKEATRRQDGMKRACRGHGRGQQALKKPLDSPPP